MGADRSFLGQSRLAQAFGHALDLLREHGIVAEIGAERDKRVGGEARVQLQKVGQGRLPGTLVGAVGDRAGRAWPKPAK
jgi:hypothetical protein